MNMGFVKNLSDDDLFQLLEAASMELKHRNGLLGPTVSDVRSKSVEENVRTVIGALAKLGITVNPQTGSGPASAP
jgi:hypothetical protein